MKKLAIALMVLFMSAFSVLSLAPMSYADDCNTHFLGLPAWYDYLPKDSNCTINSPGSEDDLAAYIWTIVINVVSMVLGIVGYLAVGFVIWGGIQYLTSTGDPGKAAKGKKTITNSLIGLAFCVLASKIAEAINFMTTKAANNGGASASEFFKSIFTHAMIWGGVICVLVMVIAGIEYATSAGNSGKTARAKNTIMYAGIGLVIMILATTIVNFVLGAIE